MRSEIWGFSHVGGRQGLKHQDGAVGAVDRDELVTAQRVACGPIWRSAAGPSATSRTTPIATVTAAAGRQLDQHHVGGALSRRGAAVRQECSARQAVKLAPVVRDIRAAGVITYAGLAKALNDRGVPTINGRTWSPTTARWLALRVA